MLDYSTQQNQTLNERLNNLKILKKDRQRGKYFLARQTEPTLQEAKHLRFHKKWS